MAIIGSQIDEINAVRENLGSKSVNIKSNVEISNLSRKKAVIFDKSEDMLEIEFMFKLDYNQKSKISLRGTIFYTDAGEKLDSIEKQWKKDKKLDPKDLVPILNHAMEIGYKNSFSISERLRLPSPLRLPRIEEKDDKKAKK